MLTLLQKSKIKASILELKKIKGWQKEGKDKRKKNPLYRKQKNENIIKFDSLKNKMYQLIKLINACHEWMMHKRRKYKLPILRMEENTSLQTLGT